jgi:Domain of unknown function (DUF4872)/Butirosin biosynthesis protein H, N-terminal
MPTDKDFKRLVRARMAKTGEAYTTARAHLRPDDPDGDDDNSGEPRTLRGRHPDTAALTRLLAALGVTDPAGGRPLTEAMALGVAGGIGFAYFVFEYETLTTFYLGGRLNSYVQKQDATEAALTRLGVRFQARRTAGPATAERHLRAALDQGRPAIVTVDPTRLGLRAVPDWLAGMLPQDVLVEPGDEEPVLWDLAPAPVPVGWAELAEARAGVRSARHRLVVAEPPAGPVDLAGAAAAGIADTWAGMLDPPMGNFGVPGLAKWARLLTAPRDPKGWPRLLADPGRQSQLLTWLYHWVETADTGGGFFRAMYAEFLEEAAGPLDRPGLGRLAGDYRQLAAAWTALAEAAVTALADDTPDPQPLDATARSDLLADLRGRVLDLADAEEAAATALREELQ